MGGGHSECLFFLPSVDRRSVNSPVSGSITQKETVQLSPTETDGGTFDIKLSKLQLFLMVPQEEMEVLPSDFLLVVEAGSRHHGPDGVLGLLLRQRAVGDFNERPAKGQNGPLWLGRTPI